MIGQIYVCCVSSPLILSHGFCKISHHFSLVLKIAIKQH